MQFWPRWGGNLNNCQSSKEGGGGMDADVLN